MKKGAETYCPRCGTDKLIPEPGGLTEYDSRLSHLPKHVDPRDKGQLCIESTTPQDIVKFVKRSDLQRGEVRQLWPYLEVKDRTA